jgi:hypothetical protein
LLSALNWNNLKRPPIHLQHIITRDECGVFGYNAKKILLLLLLSCLLLILLPLLVVVVVKTMMMTTHSTKVFLTVSSCLTKH